MAGSFHLREKVRQSGCEGGFQMEISLFIGGEIQEKVMFSGNSTAHMGGDNGATEYAKQSALSITVQRV